MRSPILFYLATALVMLSNLSGDGHPWEAPMARSYGLNAYSITIKTSVRGDNVEFRHKGDFDFYSRLLAYVAKRRGQLQEFPGDKAIRLIRDESSARHRRVSGLFIVGDAGVVRRVINLDTQDEHRLNKREGVFEPLYFSVFVPDGATEAILILQTVSGRGLKGLLQQDMKDYFGGVDQLYLKLTVLQDIEVLRAFADQGALGEVILINRGRTVESRQGLKSYRVAGTSLKDGDTLEMRLKTGPGFPTRVLKKLRSIVRGQVSPQELVSIPQIEQFDEVKVELTVGGKPRIFSLTKPDSSSVRFDITKEVDTGEDGHPTFESLEQCAADVYDDLKEWIE